MLRQDDAPANTSFLVRNFVTKTGTAVVPHLQAVSCSTSLGRMFDAVVEIKDNSLGDLKGDTETCVPGLLRKLKDMLETVHL
jgi:hypothetical protein